MDRYTVFSTDLRSSAQRLNDDLSQLQEKADKLRKAIDKVTRGDYKSSDLSSAYTAQNALNGSITRLGEISSAMNSAAEQFSEASAELSGRANLTAYYMQHTDSLSYEGLMGAYSAAITSSGSAAAGYELVKDKLSDSGYSVGSLGSVSNAVQDAIAREAEEEARRAEQAKWAKIGLTALVIAGGIAATLVTGGAASPVLIGAISGAMIAGGSTAVDQYAEHGWNVDRWDYGEIGKDAFVGGVSGAATAWIGGKLTKGITGLASHSQLGSTLLNSSNAFVRTGTGAVIGSASEIVSGIGSRGTDTFITSMIETDGDIGASLSEAKDSALDSKQILNDAVLGGIQGGKQQYKEWKLEQPKPQKIRPASNLPAGQGDDFAPDVVLMKKKGRSDVFAAGDHYDEYLEFESGNGTSVTYKKSKSACVNARDIEGISMGSSEVKNGQFWNNGPGFSREAIIGQAEKLPEIQRQLDNGVPLDNLLQDPELAPAIKSFYQSEQPIKVMKYKGFYIFADQGRHRSIAGQSANVRIPVEIVGEWR